jgi:two-component system NtrC family sensor kinase
MVDSSLDRSGDKWVEGNVALDALNSSLSGVLIANLQGQIVYVNPAFLKMFEYEGRMDVIGRNAGDLFVTQDVKRLADITAAIDKSQEATLEFTARHGDGTAFPVEVSASDVTNAEGEVVGRMASFVDITDRKALEERSVREERLAVLGQLAGGIVHELRNPLGWIKGSTYFLDMALEDPAPDVKKALELLKSGVVKSERIIESLLGFARSGSPRRREVGVNKVVRETLSTIDAPDSVEVVCRLDEPMPDILADPDQLDLVFGNLVLNAIQAMPDGGKLTVASKIAGASVLISFADTGTGISEENLERIFDPLFTTKTSGMGLGLALIKMLVEEHEGRIEVESEEGEGTIFTVRLPIESQ